jgi:hypothetical protein
MRGGSGDNYLGLGFVGGGGGGRGGGGGGRHWRWREREVVVRCVRERPNFWKREGMGE